MGWVLNGLATRSALRMSVDSWNCRRDAGGTGRVDALAPASQGAQREAAMTDEASGEIATGFGALPGTPVGRQVAWWLGMVADLGARAVPEDRERYTPALQEQLAIYLDPGRQHDAWRDHSSHIGEPADVKVERASEHEILAVLTTVKGRKWSLAVGVEPEPPHRMASFRIERRYDFTLDVREAGPDDALIVSDIERRSPIVKGETSTWFERGARYFDFTRLMDEVVVGLASVDGAPAAVTCGARHEVRVGGAVKKFWPSRICASCPNTSARGCGARPIGCWTNTGRRSTARAPSSISTTRACSTASPTRRTSGLRRSFA